MKKIYGHTTRESFSTNDIYFKEIGKLQLDFLTEKGLKPHHYLLDVGCGVLRGGTYLIEYLDEGRYYGIDAHKETLEIAKERLTQLKLHYKKPTLEIMDRFDFQRLERKFDFAMAQGVFCHIDDEDICLCLDNMRNTLKTGGRFYASFFQGDRRQVTRNRGFSPPRYTYRDSDPYHQPFNFYVENLPSGLQVEYLGEWGHPRELMMLEFVKEKTENGVQASQ